MVIEALNPSANFDIAGIWDRSSNDFVRSGDVFVGWTSKSVTVNTLKTFNATRYAPLDWPYMPFTPNGNNAVYDGITFDIAAQIGALFKDNGPEARRTTSTSSASSRPASPRTARSPSRKPRPSTPSSACPAAARSSTATSRRHTRPSNLNFGLTPGARCPPPIPDTDAAA